MKPRQLAACATVLSAFTLAAALGPGGGQYDMSYSIDAGGGTVTGGDYVLAAIIAQPDGAVLTGGAYELTAGFGPAVRCPEDVDGNGAVDVDDLVAVLLAWDDAGENLLADVTGNGVVDVDDLLAVLLAWGVCG